MSIFFYIQLASGAISYQPEELGAMDSHKLNVAENRLQALRNILEGNRWRKIADLPPLVATNLTNRVNNLKADALTAILTHTVKRASRLNPDQTDEIAVSDPLYACVWDGESEFVITLTGTFPVDGIPILGWPQTDVIPDPPPMGDGS